MAEWTEEHTWSEETTWNEGHKDEEQKWSEEYDPAWEANYGDASTTFDQPGEQKANDSGPHSDTPGDDYNKTSKGYREVPERQQFSAEDIAAFREGPTIDLYTGPEAKHAIEGASLSLLRQYSWLIEEAYCQEYTPTFHLPNSSVGALIWAYRYMQSQERNPKNQVKFDEISIPNLAYLVATCEELEYEHLANKAYNKLLYLLRQGCDDTDALATVASYVPELIDVFAKTRAGARLIRGLAGKVFQGGESDETVSALLEAGAFGERLKGEVEQKKAWKANVECFRCGQRGHFKKDCTTPVEEYCEVTQVNGGGDNGAQENGAYKNGAHEPKHAMGQSNRQGPTCYNCNQVGHLARSCPKPPKPKGRKGKRSGPRPSRLDEIELASNGEGLKTCDHEVYSDVHDAVVKPPAI